MIAKTSAWILATHPRQISREAANGHQCMFTESMPKSSGGAILPGVKSMPKKWLGNLCQQKLTYAKQVVGKSMPKEVREIYANQACMRAGSEVA